MTAWPADANPASVRTVKLRRPPMCVWKRCVVCLLVNPLVPPRQGRGKMGEKRIIKRYTNRKLYDKQESRYVTLEEIARLVRRGEDLKVIDNETDEDLTAVTFAQIILEEEKRKTHLSRCRFSASSSAPAKPPCRTSRIGQARHRGRSATSPSAPASAFARWSADRGRAIEGGRSFFDDLFELPQRRLSASARSGDAPRSTSSGRTRPFVVSSSASHTASRRWKRRSRA